MTYTAGSRSTVDAVVLLAQVDPDYTNGVIRAGSYLRLRVLRAGILEQGRVVVERRILYHSLDFPCSDRKRIMLAAG